MGFKNFNNSKTIVYLGGIFFLLVLVFVLSRVVLAKNTSSFQIKESYIEVLETDYPQTLPLVKKENGKEEIAGQIKIVDQYLISEIPENEFLDEYSYLKAGFQDLSITLETDQPLFNKENFYHPSSLFEKIKSFLGFETLPEYRITKEIDKSQSVQTKLDLSKISLATHYKETETGSLQVKQSLTLTNNSGQDLNLSLLLKNQIEADKIYWNNQEYAITENPQKFVNPDRISFDTESGQSFYDFSDVPDEFEPELWAERKNSTTDLILSLNVSLAVGKTKTIDPTYGVDITILNVHSHPQAGDNWTVSFETKGTANLTITPDDQQSIDDLDFISLTCQSEEITPQILEDDVIFYPDWSCDGTGETTHLVNVARKHTLKFQFGERVAYAYNNPDTSTYDFVGVTQESNNYYAYEKSGAASFTSQDDIGNSEATNTDYDNIESTNNVRWTTEGASTDGHYDSQLYKFYINENESSVTQLDFSWEGYGETHGTGYPTDFYAWNYNTSAWDLLQEVTFTATTDQNLTGSKTTDAGNYIDADKEVTLMVKTKKYWACGDAINYGGDTYSTKLIGNQCWLAENLKVTDGNEAQACTFTRYCYNNTASNCDTYGGLYTWTDMMCGQSSSNSEPSGVQGICPNGWHLPSHYEWATLEQQICSDIGNSSCSTTFPKDTSTTGWLGQDTTTAEGEGSAMAGNEPLWTNGDIDHNGAGDNDFGTSGLNVLPAGYRDTSGSYYSLGYDANLWSCTENDTNAWRRDLSYTRTDVIRNYPSKAFGFSARCVRD